jgi:hypothetical protein
LESNPGWNSVETRQASLFPKMGNLAPDAKKIPQSEARQPLRIIIRKG